MDENSANEETSVPDQQGGKKKKKLSRRIVVTMIFLISMSMFTYQTHALILLYLSDPIETQIKVTVNDVMDFPAVTICNLNPVRRSRWKERTMNNEPQEGMQKTMSNEREKRQTTEQSRNVVSEKAKEHPTGHNSIKRNRVKRQGFFNSWETLSNRVAENEQGIDWLDGTTKNLWKKVSILDAIHENITNLRTSLNNSLSSLRYLESRLRLVELTTTEIAEEMAKTKSYLKFLKANMSRAVDAKKNVTVEQGEGKKLLPSKDMEAFNDYLRNIGRMNKEDIETLGHQKEDFIAICSWQGSVCDPSHFDVFQNFMYGNCFTFNTSKVDPQVSGTGPYNGLSLSLFIEQNEYVDRLSPAAGVRIIIHDFDYRPFPADEGFSVAPGYSTAVFLRKTTTETVKPMCDPHIETSFEHNGQKYQYSQKACLKKCLSDEILRQCHCAGTQFLLDTKTCSNDNEKEAQCVQRLEHLARKDKLPCYCPASCRTTTYNPMISSAIWPSEKYLPSLLEELVRVEHKVLDLFENVTDFAQYFRKHFVRVDIFFQELTEQEMFQRYSYKIESLLSDIGGQLGLWIGVSVATLFESIETLTMVSFSIVNWIQTRTSRKVSPLTVIGPSTSYKPDYSSAKNSVSKVSIHWPLDPHEGLESSASRTSSKFLHVHFKESDVIT